MLGASIAPNCCWGSKSLSRAQIGSARRGAHVGSAADFKLLLHLSFIVPPFTN